MTLINFSYATKPNATVKVVTINPFMFFPPRFIFVTFIIKRLTICYHRTSLHLPYRSVRFHHVTDRNDKKRETATLHLFTSILCILTLLCDSSRMITLHHTLVFPLVSLYLQEMTHFSYIVSPYTVGRVHTTSASNLLILFPQQ